MCKVVATTLELGGQGIDMAYHYDDVTLQCTTYPFTGLISQYILTYPDMELAATELGKAKALLLSSTTTVMLLPATTVMAKAPAPIGIAPRSM